VGWVDNPLKSPIRNRQKFFPSQSAPFVEIALIGTNSFPKVLLGFAQVEPDKGSRIFAICFQAWILIAIRFTHSPKAKQFSASFGLSVEAFRAELAVFELLHETFEIASFNPSFTGFIDERGGAQATFDLLEFILKVVCRSVEFNKRGAIQSANLSLFFLRLLSSLSLFILGLPFGSAPILPVAIAYCYDSSNDRRKKELRVDMRDILIEEKLFVE
jgi:hypothetical protein